MSLVAHKLVEGLRRWLRPSRGASAPEEVDYGSWIRERIRLRRSLYSTSTRARPTFDILTLVHDPEPVWLESTARSVRQQRYLDWRWVIWDNGSKRPETLRTLARLQRDERIVLRRSERNLGITVGHAAALAHCQGEYVALLDHDDVLYPDALRVLAWHIQEHRRPPFLYSDEDKLHAGGRPHCPFFKPDWNPALLQSTGYTCHLTVFRRDLADRLGLFTDALVEGATDWDVALRFHDAGLVGVHVPEVLYSWRVHPASTAGRGTAAKPYALAGQQRCLEQSLLRRGLAGQFGVISNPLYPFVDGHWHLDWKPDKLPPVRLLGERQSGESPHRDAEFIACVPTSVGRVQRTWLHEALAILTLNPRAGMVGGRVLDDQDRVVHGLPIVGMGGPVGTAGPGSPEDEIGYFGFSLTPRQVSALGPTPWVARREALDAAGVSAAELGGSVNPFELSLRMSKSGWELLWTPHITAWLRVGKDSRTRSVGEESCLPPRVRSGLSRSLAMSADPFYSPHLTLDPNRAFSLRMSGGIG